MVKKFSQCKTNYSLEYIKQNKLHVAAFYHAICIKNNYTNYKIGTYKTLLEPKFSHRIFHEFFTNSPPTHDATAPRGPGPPHCRGFTITLRHTTLGGTPLDERSARRRDIYPTTYYTHKRETAMPPEGFEHAIPASEWLQTYTLDHSATGIGFFTS